MAHIELGNDEPGIVGLMLYRRETGEALGRLADVLLRGESTLTRGERELIAARVSALNECEFCASSHGAFAAAQLPEGDDRVSPKLSALLRIAEAVRRSGRDVTPEHVEAARKEGATDREIHDAVLIAAAFSLFNRYVDGLGTALPGDPATYYAESARRIVEHGYLPPG